MPIFRKKDKNILFVHVPKTGGSSVEQVFVKSGYKMLYHDRKVGPRSVNRLRTCTPQHMHAGLLEQLFVLDKFDFVFMVVREPIARFRSEYGFRNPKTMKIDADFVEQWAERALKKYDDNPFHLSNHLRPQADFRLPGSLVYRYEDGIDTLLADLDAKFDLGLVREIPRVHDRKARSGVSSSDVAVSESLEKRLREFYSEDFDQFGY